MKKTLLACILLLYTIVGRSQSSTPQSPAQSLSSGSVVALKPVGKSDSLKAMVIPEDARIKIAANLRTGGGLLAFSLALSAAGIGFAANNEPEIATGMGIAGLGLAFVGSVCIYHAGEWFLKPSGAGVGVTKKF